MRNILVCLCFSFFCIACTNKTSVVTQEPQKETPPSEDECFTDRKVVNQVSDLQVQVVEKMGRHYFVNENTHYEPCVMPKAYAVEGKRCMISGDVLEIFPYERRAGTPFIIKSIK